jgi:hypothetical protein
MAFNEAEGLTGVTLPNSVTRIGFRAFAYCNKLTSIAFPGNSPEIDPTAFQWTTATVFYPAGNSSYTAETMQDYGGTLTWKAVMPAPDGLLPASLLCIEEEALTGSALRYVIIPDGTSTIGKRAFADSDDLVFVNIPASVTTIAPDAFENVNGLTIIGAAGSAAESFAAEHGFAFIAE